MAKKPVAEPQTEPFEVVFFKVDDGSVPLLDWLDQLQPQKAVLKCLVLVERLKAEGHKLRFPEAEYLEDEIFQLRTKLGSVRYRMTYFFHGRNRAVLTHGFAKTVKKTPPREIERAVDCKRRYKKDPERHTYQQE